MNTRSSNTTPQRTASERPQAGPAQRAAVPQKNADAQRTNASAQSRSKARHATRVAAESEVLIVGV